MVRCPYCNTKLHLTAREYGVIKKMVEGAVLDWPPPDHVKRLDGKEKVSTAVVDRLLNKRFLELNRGWGANVTTAGRAALAEHEERKEHGRP